MHKVFISYHHANDQMVKDRFVTALSENKDVFINKSVEIGDIDPNLQTETIRQKIRDEYLRDSTVTIVLIGTENWKRKHVDWEIASSIRDTRLNHRSGLLGVVLPSYPLSTANKFDPYTIPPRLYYNWKCGFAKLYNWNLNPNLVSSWIESAFASRDKTNPENSCPSFSNNRSGDRWYE